MCYDLIYTVNDAVKCDLLFFSIDLNRKGQYIIVVILEFNNPKCFVVVDVIFKIHLDILAGNLQHDPLQAV
ncbi:hypothetical protein D3C72_1906000 [compost metagenome]